MQGVLGGIPCIRGVLAKMAKNDILVFLSKGVSLVTLRSLSVSMSVFKIGERLVKMTKNGIWSFYDHGLKF